MLYGSWLVVVQIVDLGALSSVFNDFIFIDVLRIMLTSVLRTFIKKICHLNTLKVILISALREFIKESKSNMFTLIQQCFDFLFKEQCFNF